MKQWMILVLTTALFSGCSLNLNFWSQKTPEKTTMKEVVETKSILPSQVLLYDLDILDGPYKPLGEVSVSLTKLNPWAQEPTHMDVEAKLKEEAAKKGADALIFVRYTKLGASWNRLSGVEGKAQAVKFTRY